MAEYTSNALQTVNAGQNVLFTESPIPCTRGYVIHREGSGILTLRGIVNNCNGCFARYKVSFGCNMAGTTELTEGTSLSLALAIDGEPIPTSSIIITPAEGNQFWNVYASVFVTVPRGCCYTVAVENTGTQAVQVQNANIIVERTA